MFKPMVLAVAFAFAMPVLAAEAAPSAREAEPQARPAEVASLDQRSGWGLIIGIAILGLALRRRRNGPIVSD